MFMRKKCPVAMAVQGVEVPVMELLALGIGIGDTLLHGPGKQLVEGGDVGEPSRTFEGFEKMVWPDVGASLIGIELEEFLAGGRTAQAEQHAKLAIMDVGNLGAPVWARGLRIELENVCEKAAGVFIVNVLAYES